MNVKKRIALIASLAVMAAATGCSNTVNSILDEVDNKNYSEAKSIFQSNELKDEQSSELLDELKARIENAVGKYASDEMNYDDATGLIYGIELVGVSELRDFIYNAFAEIESLHTSKTQYETAEDSFKNEDYVSAYNCYSNVIEEDCNYENAALKMQDCIDNYKIKIRKDVDELTLKNQYDEALAYLSNCTYSGMDGIKELTDSMIDEVRVKSVVYEAEEIYKGGDIESTLTLISEAQEEYGLTDNNTLNEYKNNICAEYTAMVIEKAKTQCEQENYIAALNMLKNAYEITNSPDLSSMIEEVNKMKPTYLYDLKISESKMYEIKDEGDPLTDSIGNTYPVGNLFEIHTDSGDWDDQEGYAKYCLGYKYNRLTGVISVDDISDIATATIKIVGDGVTLYELPLSRTLTPTSFSIDVSSVNWLEISMTDASDGDIYAILSDFIFSDESDTAENEEADSATDNSGSDASSNADQNEEADSATGNSASDASSNAGQNEEADSATGNSASDASSNAGQNEETDSVTGNSDFDASGNAGQNDDADE